MIYLYSTDINYSNYVNYLVVILILLILLLMKLISAKDSDIFSTNWN